ncbi:hypothetical protein CTI12_AA527510 [Artemisia annua]|uniref:No apical meristem-associated C-terminal domain-containing protein n=1 Tax=Artemisia annua TaxID=35608 RepID=A0A2U1L5Q5_ARTAN|nr:hypothetical protein CTI12_AA527510 [Artemisia annua]
MGAGRHGKGKTPRGNTAAFDAKRLKASGCDDLQVYETAQLDIEKHFRKAFAHIKAWHILKDQKKWQEQPLVGQASESTGSSKKRKSSESSSVQTPTNETPINVEDFDLPNLNENPTPTRQPRGKKKVDSGDTSRSSIRGTLASYAAEKKSLLQSQVEIQKKKDEEYFNFMNGEVMNRDMKFVMEPHDNIPDPVFKQFVIERKREICAKHGWPCSL